MPYELEITIGEPVTGKTKIEQLHDLVLGSQRERKEMAEANEPIGKAYFEVADILRFLNDEMTVTEISKTVKFDTN